MSTSVEAERLRVQVEAARAEVSRLSEALEWAVRKSGGLKVCPVCDGEWLLNVGGEGTT